jgi:hypothetical protein
VSCISGDPLASVGFGQGSPGKNGREEEWSVVIFLALSCKATSFGHSPEPNMTTPQEMAALHNPFSFQVVRSSHLFPSPEPSISAGGTVGFFFVLFCFFLVFSSLFF